MILCSVRNSSLWLVDFYSTQALFQILLKVALMQFRNVILLVFTYGYNFNCKNMIFELILSLAKSQFWSLSFISPISLIFINGRSYQGVFKRLLTLSLPGFFVMVKGRVGSKKTFRVRQHIRLSQAILETYLLPKYCT